MGDGDVADEVSGGAGMSEKRYVVPEGMLKAVKEAQGISAYPTQAVLEAAIRWQSENPVVPTVKQAQEVWDDCSRGACFRSDCLTEWQRRMYLAPEAPRFMQCDACRAKPGLPPLCAGCLHNRDLIKAYGQRYKSEFKPVKDCGYCIVGCSVNGRCPIHGDRP